MAIEVNGQKVSGIYVGSPPAIINTKLQNVVSLTNSTSNIKFIGDEIIAFNPSTDSLDVYKNSIFLTRDIDYSINTDNQSIDKIDGVWEYNADEPTKFTFIVGRNQINNLVFGDGQSIENGTITYNKLHREVTDKINKLDNGVTLSPTINLGMNNVIRKTDGVITMPKFTIQGKSYVNLLGKDGNCEDISKWGVYQTTLSLDSSKKVFGNNAIKMNLSSTAGSMYNVLSKYNFDASKYYLITAYIDRGNATNVQLYKDATGGGVGLLAESRETTPTRIGVKAKPSDNNNGNALSIVVNGTSGQYAYIDGIMLNEITADEYNNLTVDQLMEKYPYVDSYACLENPYIEVRHDNLVRNGNGEYGMGYFQIPEPTVVEIKYANGYIQIKRSSGTGYGTLYQHINVKPNITYSLRCITKISSSSYKSSVVIEQSDDGITYSWLNTLFEINSLTDTVCTGSFTPTKKYVRLAILEPNVVQGTIAYFKEISIIEGVTAPTEYKPCRIERCVIEGKFTSDDTIVYENGEVSGLLNWKHKTLYGKDYDWQYIYDDVGIKRIVIYNSLPNISLDSHDYKLIKYDGKIVPRKDGLNTPDTCAFKPWESNNPFCLIVSDSDTGWVESINPNADEVKAFMNGWKTIYTGQGKYTIFWNVTTNGQNKSDFANNSCALSTVAYTSGQTTLTVDDGSIFKDGDLFGVLGYTTPMTITSVSGNVLTIPNLGVPFPVGSRVVRCDNPSNGDLRNLTFCKSNVAPNYEGYQIHYKLANPEPIADINTYIQGDIPELDNGDNYLYLDYGIVLGEVANPVKGSDNIYRINDGYLSPYYGQSYLQNKTEIINTICRNGICNNQIWTWTTTSLGEIYGNYGLYTLPENSNYFGTNATYTIDYQILRTLHTSPTEIKVDYKQSLVDTVEDLAESVNGRQKHHSALDILVDLSVYEEMPAVDVVGRYTYEGGAIYTSVEFYYKVRKIAIPNIKIGLNYIYAPSGGGIVTNKFQIYSMKITKDYVRILYKCSDVTVISGRADGIAFEFNGITVDCRERC